MAFTQNDLQARRKLFHAFHSRLICHSQNNYQENIARALTVMNNASSMTLKKLFSDDSLFQVYKESDGVTTLLLGK